MPLRSLPRSIRSKRNQISLRVKSRNWLPSTQLVFSMWSVHKLMAGYDRSTVTRHEPLWRFFSIAAHKLIRSFEIGQMKVRDSSNPPYFEVPSGPKIV